MSYLRLASNEKKSTYKWYLNVDKKDGIFILLLISIANGFFFKYCYVIGTVKGNR